ncbi:MAG TPA: cation:proton antiporter [Gammaproteobacteria bacterium]|jgi:Kef-type K+ transport system membrane component KefB|nr:cation:proton antiporter [Gammaproteobacteria bacterium]
MSYLPIFPMKLNTISLLSIALLLGLIGGELAKRTPFLPKISGYILIGFILGPDVLNLVVHPVLSTARVFVDISLGLILFDLGRHLDFNWIRSDKGLLPAALTESGLTFTFIFLFSHYYVAFGWLPSALAGAFAMATSPAVVLMVASDLHAEGPVTRRTIIMTSLNNLFALALFTLLLPLTKYYSLTSDQYWKHAGYLVAGSLISAMIIYMITSFMAKLIGKQKQAQFVLFIAILLFSIGVSQMLRIPTAMTLFILGIATRNLDHKHALMEIDFESSAQLFFIVLFVVTGTYLRIEGLKVAVIPVLAFIVLRSAAKTIGISLFSSVSRLTRQQVLAISLALTPMAGLAISMSNVLEDFNPDINRQISTIIAAVVAILEILGPIGTQFALIKSKETISE